MKAAHSGSLSTGEAARRLSVTPDTVLKWIKHGRLPAHKTPGGHHRIDEVVIDRMLRPECPFQTEGKPASHPLRCWEFFKTDGQVHEECHQCAAYQVRASLCFELQRLAPALPHQRKFCGCACEDCPYYQQVHRLPARVLVITADAVLSAKLASAVLAGASLRFAHDIYGASAEVGAFRPSIVVFDSTLPPDVLRVLGDSIAADPRVPWVRAAYIGGSGDSCIERSVDFPVFSRQAIIEDLSGFLQERQVEAIAVEHSPQ